MRKTYHGSRIEALRACSASRALLMYKFLENAEKLGMDPEKLGMQTTWECGCFRAEHDFPDECSLKEFAELYQTEDWIKTFDSVIVESTDDRLVVNSYYCPLLEMWERLTDDRRRAARMCGIAMNGDKALAAKFQDLSFEVTKTMARGDDRCEVIVRRRKTDEK